MTMPLEGSAKRDFAAHDGPAEAADLLEQLAATGKPVLRSAS
jgi:UDP:flavonoid glycosyltransferase YjiC (YdhE family)